MIAPEQPAFPELHIHHFMTDADGEAKPVVVPRWGAGLSKREYFAALAMQGLLAAKTEVPTGEPEKACQLIAEAACKLSDALIVELSK